MDKTGVLSGRELRIAPVMTGGTSLAVWMGGVTSELHSLVERSDAEPGSVSEIYGRLLDLTATTPVIDVITGTSAGGLNGSLLAAAVCWRVSRKEFAGLYDTWMATADLEKLLRKPSQSDPPSLLKGDDPGGFRDQAAALLASWANPPGKDPGDRTDLQFERALVHARALAGEERLDKLQAAMKLVDGAYLMASDLEWVVREQARRTEHAGFEG